jgi:hypothetical protein
MNQRLEVYIDSYNAKPIVQPMDRSLSINIGDEISREDWLNLLAQPNGELTLKVKVEDVRHLFWDEDDLEYSLSIRVVPVE